MNARQTFEQLVKQAYHYASPFVVEGRVADYIPELKNTNASALGVSVSFPDGQCISFGDVETEFTVQSIAKVLTLVFTLERYGMETVFQRIGMEPTGDPFNSLMKLETASEKPFNPMINAGAIVNVGFIEEHDAQDDALKFIALLMGRETASINEAVYQSESQHGARNRSLGHLLASKGILTCDVNRCLELYFKLCSLNVTAKQLSRIGLILAMGGVDPENGKVIISQRSAQIAKTLMLTCGMYDGSGEFAVRVGVPSKSGVGGGILSCVDRRYGIGVYGPALDEKGNSVGGVKLLEYLSQRTDMHLFPLI